MKTSTVTPELPAPMEGKELDAKANTLTPELLHKMDAYWRAANYLSVGQIYLYDNPLLKRPLSPTRTGSSASPTFMRGNTGSST